MKTEPLNKSLSRTNLVAPVSKVPLGKAINGTDAPRDERQPLKFIVALSPREPAKVDQNIPESKSVPVAHDRLVYENLPLRRGKTNQNEHR